MLDKLSSSVSCSFLAKDPRKLEQIDISMPTGMSPRWAQLVRTCTNHALDLGYSHWATPDLLFTLSEPWLVYTHDRSDAVYLARMPTREAAEMWMLHRG